jgi:hypothetical protein
MENSLFLKWDSHGVDLSIRAKSTGKTIGFVLLLIVGSFGLLIGLVITAYSGAVHKIRPGGCSWRNFLIYASI